MGHGGVAFSNDPVHFTGGPPLTQDEIVELHADPQNFERKPAFVNEKAPVFDPLAAVRTSANVEDVIVKALTGIGLTVQTAENCIESMKQEGVVFLLLQEKPSEPEFQPMPEPPLFGRADGYPE